MQPALLQVTCLDSIGKRCDFVRDIVWELALPNVDTLWSRAEDAAQLPQHREVQSFLSFCTGAVPHGSCYAILGSEAISYSEMRRVPTTSKGLSSESHVF